MRMSSFSIFSFFSLIIFATTAIAVDKLPLKNGIYVEDSVKCSGLNSANTVSFWGDKLNAQRVEGSITNIVNKGKFYIVTIEGYDIAENSSIGVFDWKISISTRTKFKITTSDSVKSYKWCFSRMP